MILLFIITFAIAFALIQWLIKNAERFGLQDIPNQRSAHKKVTPRSAGLGFVGAILIVLTLFEPSHVMHYYYVYISLLFIMFVGAYDDKYNISHRLKFVGLILIACFVSYHGLLIESLGDYFGYKFILPVAISVIFTAFAIVGFTNALNLMDGLDGLAGGLSLIMLVFYFAIGYIHHDALMINLSFATIAALLAFLYFNWYPAKIFMGDSGSLSLGFIISVLSVESLHYIAPAAVLFIIAMPLMDTFIVMRRRIQRGQSPFKADKNHIHHFLYKVKVHVKFSVILLLSLQLALSIIGFQLKNANEVLSLLLFGLLFFIFLNMFDQRYRYRGPKKSQKK